MVREVEVIAHYGRIPPGIVKSIFAGGTSLVLVSAGEVRLADDHIGGLRVDQGDILDLTRAIAASPSASTSAAGSKGEHGHKHESKLHCSSFPHMSTFLYIPA